MLCSWFVQGNCVHCFGPRHICSRSSFPERESITLTSGLMLLNRCYRHDRWQGLSRVQVPDWSRQVLHSSPLIPAGPCSSPKGAEAQALAVGKPSVGCFDALGVAGRKFGSRMPLVEPVADGLLMAPVAEDCSPCFSLGESPLAPSEKGRGQKTASGERPG